MTTPLLDDLSDSARMRSGTAARLAGLPVTTLRVWERRYGVVAAPKTATGQRLYSALDVQRLRLLKRLTDCGHAIGSVAGLSVQALDELMLQEPSKVLTVSASLPVGQTPPAAPPSVGVLRAWVVGRGAAHKLESLPSCELVAVHGDLDAAEADESLASHARVHGSATPDILLVHIASLQAAVVDRVMALSARLGSPGVVVLYAFGRESLADTLRSAGANVRRDPISARELGQLITSMVRQKRPGAAAAEDVFGQAAQPAQERQFDDATLAFLMDISTNVACECPRHVAEIVMQLASFERYSQDCLSRTPADADLHAHLTAVAAAARTGFEQALKRVIAAEGIVLPERVTAAQ
jgi:MerR family transcriptional regulator, light-induced transcriptional regulator